ncbi:MFS transporter [Nocardioides dubius]|uniref:Major facilitator superfamily (MFS) profile domain-containing protein n=1 Tax=Nocardioides dubius TaxID=317019 RepID=A0ABN1TVY4_9ACTN
MNASATSTAQVAPVPERRRPSPNTIVFVLSLCGIVVSLQQTLLLPLLPELPKLLDTSTDSASWLVTATLLAGAVATPTVSRLADMYGKRRMMVTALVISLAGSLLGAISELLPLLIAARALQGVGLALVPVAIAIMRDELPREKVPLGVAIMSATLAVGAGIGLPLAGLIANHLDWHAIFWLTAIVAALLLVTAIAVLPESPVRTRGTFDLRGAILLSAALTALLLAVSKGSMWGWTSATTLGLTALGLALIGIWIPLELRTPSPLVDIRVAARAPVMVVNIVSVFAGFAMFTNMLVTTQFLQMPEATGYGLGLDVLETGWWMVPNAAAFGLMAPVSAWMTRRYSPQLTLLVGTALMTAAYAARVFLSDDLFQIVFGSVIVGVGTALAYGALPTLIMRAVPVTETASANGLNVLLRSVGTSTASAVTAAVASASAIMVGEAMAPSKDALTLALWLAAGASLCATAIGLPTLRMRAFSEEWDRAGTEQIGAETRVVRGRVVSADGDPIRNAVVTVLTPDGVAIDWGQADSEGRFNAAIPRPGDYLVVTAAEGWQPRSWVMDLDDSHPLPPIVLRQRYTLSGVITDAEDEPVVDALVVLTRATGEVVDTIRTDHEGRYLIPRPTNGRYVLTVSSREGALGARPVTVWEYARSVDLRLGTPLA